MNYLVVKNNSRSIYYEATDMEDAERNCPPGYSVFVLTDKEFDDLIDS